MNAKQRSQIQKYVDTIEAIKNDLENMRDVEEEKYDNMPEGLQESERGDQMQEGIDLLDSAIDSLYEVTENLSELL